MNAPIVRAYVNGYQEDDTVVLLRRDESGKLLARRVKAEYASYHLASQVAPHRQHVKPNRVIASARDEGDWVRVAWVSREERREQCGVAPDRGLLRHGIDSYEADVSPMRRLMVDGDIHVAKPRRAYFDIETDSRVPFYEKEKMRVLCWSVYDEAGKCYSGLLEVDTDDAERALLVQLYRLLDGFDQLLAWYGDGFDFVVIEARTRLLCPQELKHFKRLLKLDHLAVYKRMNTSAESGDEKQSMRLQDVGMAIVKEGKDNFDASRTWHSWATGGEERQRMLRYNQKDTELLLKIEQKTGYVELFQTLCEVCRVFPSSYSLKPTSQVDAYMLRLGLERGVHFPTRWHDEDDGPPKKYAGAFVLEPPKGILRDVHVGDFASMYPNIIITWNISPETKRYHEGASRPAGICVAPSTGIAFDTTRKGMLPLAVETLLSLRKVWAAKKASLAPGTPEAREAERRSTAYKVAANSFYGVVGSPFSRYYDRECSESVTQQGVWLIKHTIALAEQRGIPTKYADTDSLFVTGCTVDEFGAFVNECNEKHYPRLVAETGAITNTNKLAYEKAFSIILITGKKRYAGRYLHYKGKAATADSEPEIRGFEYRRGDTTMLARELQYEVISLLMGGELTPSVFEAVLARHIKHVLTGALDLKHVRTSKTLSKDLSEYEVRLKGDGTPYAPQPHVACARKLLEMSAIDTSKRYRQVTKYDAQGNRKLVKEAFQEVPAGTRIEYVVMDASGQTLVATPAALFDGECDRYYLWEKLVWPPTKRLLESAFPLHDWSRWTKVRPKVARKKKRSGGMTQTTMFDVAPKPAFQVVQMPDDPRDEA